jgi:hypothetical protein
MDRGAMENSGFNLQSGQILAEVSFDLGDLGIHIGPAAIRKMPVPGGIERAGIRRAAKSDVFGKMFFGG